jgi:hypothetical protein
VPITSAEAISIPYQRIENDPILKAIGPGDVNSNANGKELSIRNDVV